MSYNDIKVAGRAVERRRIELSDIRSWIGRHSYPPPKETSRTNNLRIEYKQNWPAYNAAQTEEKERFIVLLDALCKLIDQPPQAKPEFDS